jgi:hypothetical protein
VAIVLNVLHREQVSSACGPSQLSVRELYPRLSGINDHLKSKVELGRSHELISQ